MLITGNQITQDKLLANTVPGSIRGASYYLRIHSIIPAGEDAKSYDPSKPQTFHTLEPGGLAWVISEEKFQISDLSVTALVTLKSGRTKEGILALDVGLVDANFFGPIGSLIINFSKKPIRLNAGEEFFRVLFFRHDAATGDQIPPRVEFDHETYSKKTLSDMVGGYSNTFLQTSEMETRLKQKLAADVEELKSEIVQRLEPDILSKLASNFWQNNYLKIAGIAAIAILFALGIGSVSNLGNYVHTKEDIQGIIEDCLDHRASGGTDCE